jgi:hypothetical protein
MAKQLHPGIFAGLLPLPYLDRDAMDEANHVEIRRLKAAGHAVYVRKLSDGTYEIVDGGKIIAPPESFPESVIERVQEIADSHPDIDVEVGGGLAEDDAEEDAK